MGAQAGAGGGVRRGVLGAQAALARPPEPSAPFPVSLLSPPRGVRPSTFCVGGLDGTEAPRGFVWHLTVFEVFSFA